MDESSNSSRAHESSMRVNESLRPKESDSRREFKLFESA